MASSTPLNEIDESSEELSHNIQRIRNDRENNLLRLTEQRRQIEKAIKFTRTTINDHLDKIQDNIMNKLNKAEKKESKEISELLELLTKKEGQITEYRNIIKYNMQHETDPYSSISKEKIEEEVTSNDKFLRNFIGTVKDSELSYNANAAMQDLGNLLMDFGEVNITIKPCDVVPTMRKVNKSKIPLLLVSSKSVEKTSTPKLKTTVKLFKTIKTSGKDTYGCTVTWTFKNESLLKSPHGISVDNDGNVYVVGNASNNVVVISADGKQHKEILTSKDGLSNARSLDYNRSSNQLLVANVETMAMIFNVT